MLSNRLDWNRVERLVSAKVDQSHQKSICKKYSENIQHVATKGGCRFCRNE